MGLVIRLTGLCGVEPNPQHRATTLAFVDGRPSGEISVRPLVGWQGWAGEQTNVRTGVWGSPI